MPRTMLFRRLGAPEAPRAPRGPGASKKTSFQASRNVFSAPGGSGGAPGSNRPRGRAENNFSGLEKC
eukprot:34833-Pyramimonas_sp.AAC.1